MRILPLNKSDCTRLKSRVGPNIIKMIHNNIMRFFILILWFAAGQCAAHACSFIARTPFEVWKSTTWLLEGQLIEVRLNGTDIRFSDLRYFLELTNQDVHVEAVVSPTRVYIGPKQKTYTLHFWHNRDSICGGVPSLLDTSVWRAQRRDGRFGERDYFGGEAVQAVAVPKAGIVYLDVLRDIELSEFSSTANDFIAKEAARLVRLVAGDKSLDENSFFTNPSILADLPIDVLQARLDFLIETGLSIDELARTQAAIQMN